jgi:formate dehydrogenase major subunit/formate dehydrogenase alpha subunit
MGGLPNVYTAYQQVTDLAIAKKMEEAWGVSGLSTKVGLKVTEMMPKAHSGELKALYIIGENPLVSDADLNHAQRCMENLEFLVVQDIFMTETAQMADVVLPSACFAEKEGTFSNTERRVQRVRKAVDAPGEAKDDWWITGQIANRMGYEMNYPDGEAIFNELAKVTPSYAGITYERIDEVGLHWPCPTTDHPGTPILHGQQFTRGKGLFHAIEWIPPAEQIDDEYPFYMTTGRVLYQYHTGTMTMKTEGLNERAPESFVEMAKADAVTYDLKEGDKVVVSSRRGEITARVKISAKAVEGTIFIPFHYARAAANKLTNAVLDPVSGIPELKVCAVKIAKAA